MKSDLSKVKVGDSIWTIQEGWTVVVNIEYGSYPIVTKQCSFTKEGKYTVTDQYPSAFLTNPFDGYKVDEAFIKEAHQSACSDWKTKIKDKFPDVFKSELEVNKWYKSDLGGLWFVTEFINDYEQISYGISWFGNWDILKKRQSAGLTLANESEVKEVLINEAKKRGFKEGVNVGDFNGIKRELVHSNSFALNGNLFFMGGTCIFKNGTWAEIIQQPIELTLEEIAEKFNVDVKLLKIKK